MPNRPCENLHIPLIPETCSYCWRAIHVRSYQRLWGIPETGEYKNYSREEYIHYNHYEPKSYDNNGESNTVSTSPQINQPMRKLYSLPCIHEGNILEYCHGCNGESRHVRECDKFEKCTRGYVSVKVRSCVKCAVEANSPYQTEQSIEQEKKEQRRREKMGVSSNSTPSEQQNSNENSEETQPVQPIQPVQEKRLRMNPNQASNRVPVPNRRILLREKSIENRTEKKEVTELRNQNKNILVRSKLKTTELNWTCGITTVPVRRTTTLPKTIESVINAGFPIPQLFIDVQDSYTDLHSFMPDLVKEYTTDFPLIQFTIHSRNIRTFGNWYLALLELYIRQPKADRYVLFQDDIILSRNVREYLEHCEYPERGYMNLITYPDNEHERAKYFQSLLKERGWYQSNQKGKGAQALIFNKDTLLELLGNDYIHQRLQDEKGWQGIDGGISTALKLKGYIEYVHSPSLVRHIGNVTTMGDPKAQIGNPLHHPQTQPQDLSFRGEDWDALEMIKDMQ